MLFLASNTILILIWYSKVHLLEDSTGNIHLKNLSLHQATNEEEGEVLMKGTNCTTFVKKKLIPKPYLCKVSIG